MSALRRWIDPSDLEQNMASSTQMVIRVCFALQNAGVSWDSILLKSATDVSRG